MKGDSVNKIVTDKIIDMIETGKLNDWHKAFKRIKRNIDAKKNYSALNQLLLCGDTSEYYITPKKAIEKHLNFKGAKKQLVTFWKVTPTTRIDPKTNENVHGNMFMLRYYEVIGFDSIADDEVKAKLLAKKSEYKNNVKDFNLDALIKKVNAEIKTGQSGEAYYSLSRHYVSMPKIETFDDTASYYKTLFHELVHWTGHKSILDRHDTKGFEFVEDHKEKYSKEELVAEIGSAMLSEYFNMNDSVDSLKNSASYIKHWVSKLKDDHNMIVQASGKADKAVNYILTKMGLIETEKEESGEMTETA